MLDESKNIKTFQKDKVFFQGIYDVLPLLIPVVPFGIIYGVLGIELGLSPLVTFCSSFIIFGGASQLVLVNLFSAGASPLVILGSVSVVNSRHLLYSAVLSQFINKLNLPWRLTLGYLMTDQAFSVSYRYFASNKHEHSHFHMFGSGLTLWLIWQISTLSGILLGSIIPEELGLEFTIPLTFVSLLVYEFRKLDYVVVMLVSGLISVLTFSLPFKAYIIISAIIGLIAAYLINLKLKVITK